MIKLVPLHAAGTPSRWILAFARRSTSRWVNRVPGKYKHVMAMGYVAEMDSWVFFDWRLGHADIYAARGDGAKQLMAHYADGADLLGMPARRDRSAAIRCGLWCVPSVKHLVGIRGGALRADALWRDCLRQGAEILSDENQRASRSPGLSSATA